MFIWKLFFGFFMKRKIEANRKLYVIPLGSGWAVKEDGKANFKLITDRKSEAVLFAKEISKNENVVLSIYDKNGTLKSRYIYGQDF